MSIKFKGTDNDKIALLNTNAEELYFGRHSDKDKNNSRDLIKGVFMSGLIQIEGTTRGTFNCDLFIKNADIDLLKQMYPVACDLFKIETQKDVIRLGKFLDKLRNINAHAYLSYDDSKFFNIDLSFLSKISPINENVFLFDKKKGVTIAGLFFLLLLFLREETIISLYKKAPFISLIFDENISNANIAWFVKNYSKVNLEIPIRKTIGFDLITAIFGEYKESTSFDGNKFSVSFGANFKPIFQVSGTLEDNEIFINKGSLTKSFYLTDYDLKIEDLNGFIELSNQLPPFVFIDYLYFKKINIFNKSAYEQAKKEWFYVLKLNKPKFYCNKNINILFLPKENAGFTLVSSILIDGLNIIFLRLESAIYRKHNLGRTSATYSTIQQALEIAKIPEELSKDVIILRNFSSHGYILDETAFYSNKPYAFTIDYVVSTLERLLEYLKTHDEHLCSNLAYSIAHVLVRALINSKYRKIIEYSNNFINTYPNFNKEELDLKNSYVDHAQLDINKFIFVYDYMPFKDGLLKIYFKDINSNLYYYANWMDTLENFCLKNNLKLQHESLNGIIDNYTLCKK